MTFEELKKLMEEIAVAQTKLTKQQTELTKQQQELKESQRQTDEQMKKTDQKLERMGITLGNITNNNGEIAEEFFYTSFEKNKKLGEIKYDDIGRNWLKERNNIKEEYDIIMTNGKSIAIIEVKAKAHETDIEKLERKVGHFRKLFPVYKNFNIYGGLATLVLTEVVEKNLIKKGFFAIKQQGDHIIVHSPNSFYVPKKHYPPEVFIPRVF